jgi:hypothetical protein
MPRGLGQGFIMFGPRSAGKYEVRAYYNYNSKGWVEGDIRNTFTHELLHALDDITQEEWYQTAHFGNNDVGLRYAVNQEQKDVFSSIGITHRKTKGFSRVYGRVDPSEDRATIFEFLTKSSSEQLHDRIDEDVVLTRKIIAVTGRFLRRSFGLMDGRYWDMVRNEKKIPQGYFERETERILQTPYEAYASDERHFNTGGLRIMDAPTREEYEAWQQSLRDKEERVSSTAVSE